MLLETLDLRTNDILIYSQNIFNFNDSFKIIYKNEKVRQPHRISYFDVCAYVKDPSPKNLIIYRLLTNVNNLDAFSTKYGYFIKINGKVELVYLDPIFAIKDLRHLRFDLEPDRFRFKIQQVGLTSLTKKETEPNFAEVYSFDLKAIESQSQNDKIFADAIFAFDDNFIDEDYVETKFQENRDRKGQFNSFANDINSDLRTSIKKISEDKNPTTPELKTPNAPEINKMQDLREEIIDLLKQALGIEGQTKAISEQEKYQKTQIQDQKEVQDKLQEGSNLFDLFKTTNKSNEISSRERDTVILKFD
jgi:hypothetical protein